MPRPSTANYANTAAAEREFAVNITATGAGAANPTLVKRRGVTSFVRNGVGVYTLTMQDVGGALAGFRGIVHTATTVNPLVAKIVPATLNLATRSVQVEFWSLVTPALTDPPAASLIDLEIAFFDNILT